MAHGEPTHGMALGSHILLGNHEFTLINGLMSVVSSYLGQGPHTGNLNPTVEPCLEQRPYH
jgi:hypothetical protein